MIRKSRFGDARFSESYKTYQAMRKILASYARHVPHPKSSEESRLNLEGWLLALCSLVADSVLLFPVRTEQANILNNIVRRVRLILRDFPDISPQGGRKR